MLYLLIFLWRSYFAFIVFNCVVGFYLLLLLWQSYFIFLRCLLGEFSLLFPYFVILLLCWGWFLISCLLAHFVYFVFAFVGFFSFTQALAGARDRKTGIVCRTLIRETVWEDYSSGKVEIEWERMRSTGNVVFALELGSCPSLLRFFLFSLASLDL